MTLRPLLDYHIQTLAFVLESAESPSVLRTIRVLYLDSESCVASTFVWLSDTYESPTNLPGLVQYLTAALARPSLDTHLCRFRSSVTILSSRTGLNRQL